MSTPLKISAFLLLIFALILISGCATSNTDSTNIKTSGIYATFEVEQKSETEIQISATLTVGNALGTDVKLSDGEKLYCNNVPLERHIGFTHVYTTTFYTPSTTGYVFKLVRNDEKPIETTAPAMPTKPNITNPSVGFDYKKGNSLPINWTLVDSSIDINVYFSNSYKSLTITDSQSSDSGECTITAAQLSSLLATEVYDLTVTISRFKKQSINSAFGGGYTKSKYVTSNTVKCTIIP